MCVIRMHTFAWIFGAALTLIGALGFVPWITTTDSYLLGVFLVDPVQNLVHIMSGFLAMIAAWGAGLYARLYFQVFGVLYSIIAIAGLFSGETVLGLFMTNAWVNLLHVVVAASALWLGFGVKESVSGTTTQQTV